MESDKQPARPTSYRSSEIPKLSTVELYLNLKLKFNLVEVERSAFTRTRYSTGVLFLVG